MSTLILDIDTQKEFMNEGVGSHYVKDSEHIKEKLSKILTYSMRNGLLVSGTVNIRDADSSDDDRYCMEDATGYEKIDDSIIIDRELYYNVPCLRHGIDMNLVDSCYQIYFEKYCNNIWDEIFGQPDNLMTLLRTENITDVIIIGMNVFSGMTHAIYGLLDNKYNVTVITDCVSGDVDDVLSIHGVTYITTEEFLLET